MELLRLLKGALRCRRCRGLVRPIRVRPQGGLSLAPLSSGEDERAGCGGFVIVDQGPVYDVG